MTFILQTTAESRRRESEARIHELEDTMKTIIVTGPTSAVSQPASEAAVTPPQSIPSALDVPAPAASMEVNVGSPPRMVSFLAPFKSTICLQQCWQLL